MQTVNALTKTRHGCAWLHFHWEMLAESLRSRGDLEGAEWELARQLQGIPESLRFAPSELSGTPETRLEWINQKLDELDDLIDGPMKEVDAMERSRRDDRRGGRGREGADPGPSL